MSCSSGVPKWKHEILRNDNYVKFSVNNSKAQIIAQSRGLTLSRNRVIIITTIITVLILSSLHRRWHAGGTRFKNLSGPMTLVAPLEHATPIEIRPRNRFHETSAPQSLHPLFQRLEHLVLKTGKMRFRELWRGSQRRGSHFPYRRRSIKYDPGSIAIGGFRGAMRACSARCHSIGVVCTQYGRFRECGAIFKSVAFVQPWKRQPCSERNDVCIMHELSVISSRLIVPISEPFLHTMTILFTTPVDVQCCHTALTRAILPSLPTHIKCTWYRNRPE